MINRDRPLQGVSQTERGCKMKTLADLDEELYDLEKCILFETDRKALRWYIIEYIERYCEIVNLEMSLIYHLN